jgi:pantothenate kinase-related protein Tda10
LPIVGFGAGDRADLPKLTVIDSTVMLLENFFIGGRIEPG